ncbi:MAG: hypothetical protein HKL96_05260 [Phycisphaerales bacterium]|nr:hypothetical protein [Phycisphaerales bacterium]
MIFRRMTASCRFTLCRGRVRAIAAAAIAVALLLPAIRPALADSSTNQTDRIRDAINHLDDSLAVRMLLIPAGEDSKLSVPAVQVTYRIILRNLFKSALLTHYAYLRATLMNRADELATGMKGFDDWTIKTLASGDADNALLTAFIKAGKDAAKKIRSFGLLNTYTNQVLAPLQPLALAALAAPKPPVIWPLHRVTTHAVFRVRRHLPPFALTIAAVQGANIMPDIRTALKQVLMQLQQQSNNQPDNPAIQNYYSLMLHCLSLAKRLQASSILGAESQSKISRQLWIGLALFKDERTRSAGIRRLRDITEIVHSLHAVAQSALPSGSRMVLGRRLHEAIEQLSSADTRQAARSQIAALLHLVAAYNAFAAAAAEHPKPALKLAWSRVKKAGESSFDQTMILLQDQYDRRSVQQGTMKLGVIAGNLQRIADMPAEQTEALIYKPKPEGGVQRNIARWAKHIGMAPDSVSDASRNFDAFKGGLYLLSQIRRAMPQSTPDAMIRRLSAGHYDAFIKLFFKTQQDLINSLASPRFDPRHDEYQLTRELAVFQATRNMAAIESPGGITPLAQLNAWGGWQLSPAATRLLRDQLEQALAGEYASELGLATSTDAWINFAVAAPAINNLAAITGPLVPQLTADPAQWATYCLKASEPVPGNALFGNSIGSLMLVCMHLNDAAYDHADAHDGAAQSSFQEATSALTHMQPQP